MFDVYNDNGNEVIKSFLLQNKQYITELEKTASEGEVILKNELTKEAFADQDNKMFPIYDKASTNLSSLYIMAQADEVPAHVKLAAQEACNAFDIDYDLVSFEKIASAKTTKELVADDFIFDKVQKLPVVDKETLDMSCRAFEKIAYELPFEDLVYGATRFLEKAASLDIELNDTYKKWALQGLINDNKFVKIATERLQETLNMDYKEVVESAQDSFTKVASYGANAIVRMFEIDSSIGLNKVAETLENIVELEPKSNLIEFQGDLFYADKIAGIPTDEWVDVLPAEEVNYFIPEEGEFDKVAFEHLANTFTPQESDIVKGFLQKYI